MFSDKLTESLRIKSLLYDSSPWKKKIAATVGITKVAMIEENKNLVSE